MTSIDSFIEKTNAAVSSEEIFSLFEDALRGFGYDRICYSLITDHPSLGLKTGHGVMRNYPDDWMGHYMASGYDKKDPVPQYCFATSKPFTWNWVVTNVDLNADQRRVMHEAQEAKLLDGIAIPMYGQNGEIAGVGLASSAGGVNPDKDLLCKIRALAFQFHLAYTEKESNEAANFCNIRLTEREKQILLWAAEGKSDQSIADITGVSYPTVRFHMNNIFRKLNANERTFAIVKAIRHGLILPTYVSLIRR